MCAARELHFQSGMKRIVFASVLSSLLLSAPAFAGVSIGITFEAPPPVVIVSPGVQVVEDSDDEIFVSNGYYYVYRDDVWYRTSDYHGGWVVYDRERVPVFIRNSPHGHYKHYKHEAKQEKREEKRESHESKGGKGHGNGKH